MTRSCRLLSADSHALAADLYEHHSLLAGELTAAEQAQYESLKYRVNALHASKL